MNADLNSLLQKLNEYTEEYPAEEVIHELQLVSERITFAQIQTDQTAQNQSLQNDIEYLLSRDVSPPVMGYVRYLMQQNMLGLLSDQMGQVFIGHCETFFLSVTQLTFRTPITLRDEMKQQVRMKLKQVYPLQTRITFDTDASLLAGFIVETRGEIHDRSLKSQVVKLLESYIKQKTVGGIWMS